MAVLLGVGVSYAYVSSTGTGTGSATGVGIHGTSVDGPTHFTITFDTDFPLDGKIYNPNTFPVQVKALTVTVISVPAGCKISDFHTHSLAFSPPVQVPSADDNGWGYYDWSGASVRLVDDPGHAQNLCVGGGNIGLSYVAS